MVYTQKKKTFDGNCPSEHTDISFIRQDITSATLQMFKEQKKNIWKDKRKLRICFGKKRKAIKSNYL